MTDRTNAERQRRYIARLKAGVSNAPAHPVSNDARIAELEKALADSRATARLRQERAAQEIDELEKKLTATERELKDATDKAERLQWSLEQQPQSNPKAPWTKSQYMQLVKCLHPDRAKAATSDELHAALLLLESQKHLLLMGAKEEQDRKAREQAEEWRRKWEAVAAQEKVRRKAKRDAAKAKKAAARAAE